MAAHNTRNKKRTMEALGLNTSDPDLSSPPKTDLGSADVIVEQIGSASKKSRVEPLATAKTPEPTNIPKNLAGGIARGLTSPENAVPVNSQDQKPSAKSKSPAPRSPVKARSLSKISPVVSDKRAPSYSPNSPLSTRAHSPFMPESYPLEGLSSGMISHICSNSLVPPH
jgi:hypothetical protein